MSTFSTHARERIGKRVTVNIGNPYPASGKLIAVHSDCLELEIEGRPAFIPLAAVCILAESAK